MKQLIILIVTVFVLKASARSQNLQPYASQLDYAGSAVTYQQLAEQFGKLANDHPANWLLWYYAAFCNAKTGWLLQDDGDRIEPFADKADQQIAMALSLLDTTKQRKELSEVYVIMSMTNRARVFINPMTYGRKYGPVASRYNQLALQTNPNNGRALYLAGWEKYSTPKLWGGDKQKAKELLQQASGKLNAQASDDNPRWGKRETDELLAKLK
ncbi:MAG TPA: hypothetical protein VIM79_16790 [Niastella sp.]